MQEVRTRERIRVLFNLYSLYTTYFLTKKRFSLSLFGVIVQM